MIWPRRIRSQLREGELELVIKMSQIPIPNERSPFQQKRLRRCLEVVDHYLKNGKTTKQIGKEMGGLTHQRVVQLLQFGLTFLMDRNYIREATPPPVSLEVEKSDRQKRPERSTS